MDGGMDGRGLSPPPRILDTLLRQNLRLIHFAQEALLLLLLGVASNMVAFGPAVVVETPEAWSLVWQAPTLTLTLTLTLTRSPSASTRASPTCGWPGRKRRSRRAPSPSPTCPGPNPNPDPN